MLESGRRRFRAGDRDGIQPQPPALRCIRVSGDPRHRQAPEPLKLALVDRLERMTEPETAARLDLDDRQDPRSSGDEIDLTVVDAPVAVQDGVSTGLEILRRAFFSGTTQSILCCHEGIVARRGASRAAVHRLREEAFCESDWGGAEGARDAVRL